MFNPHTYVVKIIRKRTTELKLIQDRADDRGNQNGFRDLATCFAKRMVDHIDMSADPLMIKSRKLQGSYLEGEFKAQFLIKQYNEKVLGDFEAIEMGGGFQLDTSTVSSMFDMIEDETVLKNLDSMSSQTNFTPVAMIQKGFFDYSPRDFVELRSFVAKNPTFFKRKIEWVDNTDKSGEISEEHSACARCGKVVHQCQTVYCDVCDNSLCEDCLKELKIFPGDFYAELEMKKEDCPFCNKDIILDADIVEFACDVLGVTKEEIIEDMKERN